MPPFDLHAIDVRMFEVFSVATPRFWRLRSDVVLGLFSHLKSMHGSTALLISQEEHVCEQVSRRGISCVVSRHFSNQSVADLDTMMSKERWFIIDHFLQRGQRIIHCGADLRFTQPPRRLFEVSGSVDSAVDGLVNLDISAVVHFTPDLLLFNPTAKGITFVRAILAAFRAPTAEGLPPELLRPEVMRDRKGLMGPAQQDLLMDTLLSTFYSRPVSLRKIAIAHRLIAHHASNTELPTLAESSQQLGRLDVRQVPTGAVVHTPQISMHFSNGRSPLPLPNTQPLKHTHSPANSHSPTYSPTHPPTCTPTGLPATTPTPVQPTTTPHPLYTSETMQGSGGGGFTLSTVQRMECGDYAGVALPREETLVPRPRAMCLPAAKR